MSKHVIMISKDLFFITKVKEMAAGAGATVTVARSRSALDIAVGEGGPSPVIVIDAEKAPMPLEEISAVVAPVQISGATLLTFFSHVNEQLESDALQLGLGAVMPRSRFVKVLPDLLRSE